MIQIGDRLGIPTGMTTLAPNPSRPALVALLLASALATAPAHAEVPSVDAYAGQALVLGTGHRHHPGGGSGTGGGRSGASLRSGQNHTEGTGGERSATVSGSGQSQAKGPGAGESVSGGTPAAGSAAGDAARTTATGSRSTGARSGASGAGEEAFARAHRLRSTTQGGSDAGTFSGTDLLVLIAALVCLVGVATTLRVTRHSGRAAARRP